MPRKEIDPELSRKVLEYRRAGLGFDRIAEQLDLTPTSVKAIFDKALGSYDKEYLAALEADRLDRLHAAVWPQAARGDLLAVDRIIKISERRERVLAEPKENDHALRVAFDASVESSTQVQTVDSALVSAGAAIADRVDEARATGEGQELTKALYLLPHMVNVLRELLATPASRQSAGLVATEPKEGKLAALKLAHGQNRAG